MTSLSRRVRGKTRPVTDDQALKREIAPSVEQLHAAGRRIGSQVRTAHYSRHAFKGGFAVAMNVPTQHHLDVIFLEQLEHYVPIGDSVIQRIMR